MATTSLLDRIGRNRAQQLMSDAVQDAVAHAKEKGVSVTGMVNGKLSQTTPDGKIEPIQKPAATKKKHLAA